MVRKAAANEVVVIGNQEGVKRLAERAKADGQGIQEKGQIRLEHGGRTLSVTLFHSSMGRAHAGGKLLKWAQGDRLKVAVGPNPFMANPRRRARIEVNPWEWEDNPWEWDDNPWEWDDNPWEWDDNPWEWDDNPAGQLPAVVAVPGTPSEAEVQFWRQSAFQAIGLTDASGQRNPLLSAQGEGVVVGLFDALPAKPVAHPWLTLHRAKGQVNSPANSDDLSDHGLITASLVHAVAPKAELHLYEVCGKCGSGSLFPLLEALESFIAMAAGRRAVISLSLGSMTIQGTLPLRVLLKKATDLGMVVCAAAGNQGQASRKPSVLPTAQVPAAFPNVIAVSASNLSDQRASYSQRGDIAAPGGEGLGNPGPDDLEDIIGMGVSVGDSGYVRMDGGTSFATPLVAGAVALVLQGESHLDAGTYSRVHAALKSCARRFPSTGEEGLGSTGLGTGILYLPALVGC